MAYLITKISLCLMLATLIGAFIGWQLRGMIYRHHNQNIPKALESAHEQVQTLEQERDALFMKLDHLEQDNIDLNQQLMEIGTPVDEKPITGLEEMAERLKKLEATSQALKSRVDGIDCRTGCYPLIEIGELTTEELPLFRRMGIENTHQLIEYGATRDGRREITEKTGIDEKRVQTMVNIADLLRIPGVTSPIANLIVAAGIQSAPNLAEQKPYKFALRLKEINAEKQQLSTCPGASIISHWIREAAKLDPRLCS